MACSVVLPYYQRPEVLAETLETYCEHYGPDIEIIVVDDGSPQPVDPPGVKIIRLPRKTVGYAPVIPINIGVEYASHDVISISLPEARHPTPVLYAMREYVDDNAYVSARVWCEATQRWLASPDHEPGTNQQHGKPLGVPFNFCVMFTRALWERLGGMDRAYRWGSHFDDTDWAMRVARSGAEIRWVDDVVIHTRKQGARAPWVNGGWAYNRDIFAQRWPDAL